MQSRLLLLGSAGAAGGGGSGGGGSSARRMRLILRQVVRSRPGPEGLRLRHTGAGADAGDTINIGDVSYKLKTPKNPELVPKNYSKKH